MGTTRGPRATHPKSTPRNAADTRARILAAARTRFSQNAYENVGVRDIASDAGVDAALVNRYFGGKELLFEAVIQGAFELRGHLAESMDDLGRHLARQILADPDGVPMEGFDPLRLLLRAAGNPETAGKVSACFHAEFVLPLATLLRGADAPQRAALAASYIIGLATMRHALGSPLLANAGMAKAVALAGAAIQACING